MPEPIRHEKLPTESDKILLLSGTTNHLPFLQQLHVSPSREPDIPPRMTICRYAEANEIGQPLPRNDLTHPLSLQRGCQVVTKCN